MFALLRDALIAMAALLPVKSSQPLILGQDSSVAPASQEVEQTIWAAELVAGLVKLQAQAHTLVAEAMRTGLKIEPDQYEHSFLCGRLFAQTAYIANLSYLRLTVSGDDHALLALILQVLEAVFSEGYYELEASGFTYVIPCVRADEWEEYCWAASQPIPSN